MSTIAGAGEMQIATMGDGARIAWRSDGDVSLPPLILSNSLGTDHTMWAPQMAALSKVLRVIRYDTRGHGASSVPAGAYGLDRLGCDVVELADHLGLERFAFCGLSLGGMTGQWLAVRVPDRLVRLVIANSSPYMGPPLAWDTRIGTVLKDGMPALVSPVLERWFTEDFRASPTNYQAVEDVLLRTDPNGYAGCCAAIRDMDMRPFLRLIDVPTVIVGGTQDIATPPPHSQALAEGISGSRCHMLSAAHLSNVEQAERFTEILLDEIGGGKVIP